MLLYEKLGTFEMIDWGFRRLQGDCIKLVLKEATVKKPFKRPEPFLPIWTGLLSPFCGCNVLKTNWYLHKSLDFHHFLHCSWLPPSRIVPWEGWATFLYQLSWFINPNFRLGCSWRLVYVRYLCFLIQQIPGCVYSSWWTPVCLFAILVSMAHKTTSLLPSCLMSYLCLLILPLTGSLISNYMYHIVR